MVNVMDILDLIFNARAVGDKGQECESGFAIVICTMPVTRTCAKRALLVSELRNSSSSGCFHLEHMAGRPAALHLLHRLNDRPIRGEKLILYGIPYIDLLTLMAGSIYPSGSLVGGSLAHDG
jgi:hypothetical protein